MLATAETKAKTLTERKREVILKLQIFGNGGNISRGVSVGFHKKVP